MQCIRCDSRATRRDGRTQLGGQRWRCNECRRRFTARSRSTFSRRWFTDELISLATRWYVRYRLSYADVVEWLAERGVMIDRSTVYRWVQRFLPLFAEAARAHRVPVGGKWCVDETYCAVSTADGPTAIERSIRRAKSWTSTSEHTAQRCCGADVRRASAITGTGVVLERKINWEILRISHEFPPV